MATAPVDLTQQSQLIPPQAQPSQEHTSDAPMVGTAQDPPNNGNISKEDQQTLIALARSYRDQWSQDRLILVQRVLENLEFFKGNQNIVFGPGTTQFTSTQGWMDSVGSQHSQDADDDTLYQDALNFYQMLCIGFVAALSPQVPRSKWIPDDADQLTDVATAKAAQILIDKVERDNKEASLLRLQLLFMYNTGTVYRFTRYVVSKRNGTTAEPVYDATETEIMPARMHCFNCGADGPGTAAQCATCKQPMGQDSFYPPVSGPVTRQVGTQQVPNGIVKQNLYCALEVDVDPKAEEIEDSPILNLEFEVHVGALRAAYPDMFSQIQASATSELSTNGSIDRIARQQLYSQTDGQSSILSDQRPTLSQTWFQPWAFALQDDEAFVDRMTQAFPDGCLLINTGPTFLSVQPMDMNKHWTVAKTHPGFGMNPPCPGDIVKPFQRRYNNLGNLLQDGMERTSAGITIANNDLIDSKSFQGKRMLAGSLNPVKLKRTGAPGSLKLSDAIHQFTFDLKVAEMMEYQKYLMFSGQQFACVQPQVYGGAGDPNVQTAAGQQQQLNTAHGTMGIYWENLKDEHAKADELAVECAQENLTSDLKYSIEDKGAEYRSQYVRLDDLQGSIRAYSDEDQGMPVTPEELQQRWMSMLQAATDKNPVMLAAFDDPENQEQCADAIGVPGMVVPGAAMRNKVSMVIEKLLKAQPIPQVDPQTGQPTGQAQPSIMPDQDIDDFTILKQVVRRYCQENSDLPDDNPEGWQNLLAYFKAAVAMETAQNVQQAQAQGTALGAGKQASLPPPPPKPQLSPAQQSLLAMARADGVQGMTDLAKIAGSPPTTKGSSYQAQVAAAAKLVDVAAKAEQLNVDVATPQGQ